MLSQSIQYVALLLGSAVLLRKVQQRIRLSRAKHPSLRGHPRMSRILAAQVPMYGYDEVRFFNCDGATPEVTARRRAGFAKLSEHFEQATPASLGATEELESAVPDMQFTNLNRVPFQFREYAGKHLRLGAFAEETSGVSIRDLDGNWAYDVSGSYGVNLLGYDFYKQCIERGEKRARGLGPVLGPYHPVIASNVNMIREISGLDEVSFHMSGTEAVMQAVRLARFHTRKSQLVLFCGAYHGWWDGVQAGIGHRRSLDDVYMLSEMSERSLQVLRTRRDIACVLVNPLQALHPNAGASSDAMLVNSERHAGFDREAYAGWLRELRQVCTERSIALIFDEVFVGFRLGLGGAQQFFGVRADMVTYGKTIGGGLPVGVLAGRADLMKRHRPDRPADLCFARGTFNSHPYVMASMNEFLNHVTRPEIRSALDEAGSTWNARASLLNGQLSERALPVRIHNLSSIWTISYTSVSRYNWMFQYYLRAAGLALSWVGTGRLIFSHNYSNEDFEEVCARFIRAAERMRADGWWEAATQTNRSIRKKLLREILASRFS